MIKKVIAITTLLVVTLGVTLLAYAKEKDDKVVKQSFELDVPKVSNENQDKINNDDIIDISNNYMMNMMEQNRYEDIANEVRNGNYKSMDDFMNNITEEDYQKMIDMMRENGYEDMNIMMEKVGREEMIKIHKSIDGIESCHKENGSFENNRSMMN